MTLPITVVIPVGPQPAYRQFLPECLASVKAEGPEHIILVNDMARFPDSEAIGCQIIQNYWLCGAAMSWNFGVAVAPTDAVFLMGSDDKLLPGCLEACWEAYQGNRGLAAWYNVTCGFEDGSTQWLPNNAAMVTKNLWRLTGGFPPSAFAGPDALHLSIMMVHMPDRILQVKQGVPLYWCRQHPDQDTNRMAKQFNGPMNDIRNIETERWQPPFWTANL